MKDIKKEDYRLYQLDWMMRHGKGIDNFVAHLNREYEKNFRFFRIPKTLLEENARPVQ